MQWHNVDLFLKGSHVGGNSTPVCCEEIWPWTQHIMADNEAELKAHCVVESRQRKDVYVFMWSCVVTTTFGEGVVMLGINRTSFILRIAAISDVEHCHAIHTNQPKLTILISFKVSYVLSLSSPRRPVSSHYCSIGMAPFLTATCTGNFSERNWICFNLPSVVFS